jgi:Fe2+ or Zn2+ uptake regulation protein
MPSTVVALLAERPETELRTMQSRLEAERARVESERARIEFELEQITEAIARKSRPAAKPKGGRRPTRPGATQKRILDAVARLPQPVSPAEIIAEMESHGPAGNRGTIHNAIGRLVKTGRLDKLDVGQYQLASQNGSTGESHAGPSENGTSQPLSTAGQPQEGA